MKRGQGRPKMTWRTEVKNDMKDLDLQIEIVENRNEWKRRIYVEDY